MSLARLFRELSRASVRPADRLRRAARSRGCSVERLEGRSLLAADVIITEFMAANQSTVFDGDGDASDWVEIYNRGDESQDLSGWFLTDNRNRLDKWEFPSVTIDPGESILVWPSDKDPAPAGELHTTWGLSRGGEFLGLVRPDATTIVSQFAPAFPEQFTDVSYGYATIGATTTLVSHASATQVLIPTSGALGTTWTSRSFTPNAAWQTGTQGVGYDTAADYGPLIGTNVAHMRGANGSAFIRIPFNVATANFDTLSMRVRYDDGFVAYLNGQEIARRNAPATLAWNSTAPADRVDSIALQWETIDLSAAADIVAPGENVLAIHGLNVVPTSSDFLIDAELTASKIEVRTDLPPRFFRTPTPGEPNIAGTLDARPLVLEVSHTEASDAADIVVTAQAIATSEPVARVDLHYRVMYGGEVTVRMFDDGQHGDGAAGDGFFGAAIPASASSPGQMVRYYVTASTADGDVGRFPLFTDPAATAQYLGDVIPDPNVTSQLPIFQIFTQNPNWFRNSNGTINRSVAPGSFYYAGRFYDNIHLSVRGDTSIANAYPNQKLRLEFNEDDKFQFDDGREEVGSFNLDNVFQDPSFGRLTLGMELFREAGAYAQLVEPVHTRVNGQFYSLGIFSERYNKPFLRRNGLDDDGAVYESEGVRDSQGFLSPSAGGLQTTSGMEKDNREEDPTGFADLAALIAGISPSNPNRFRYIFDNVNIPEVLDVLAVYSITKHFDRDTHNYYVYRDSDGNGEWSLLPYDLDIIWDRLIEPLYSTNFFSGHPFEGSSQDPTWAGTHYNRLHDAFADSPVLREMLLRRLRTLMDELLQPPSTPVAERKLEAKLDALFARLQPEAALDRARWGTNSGGAWGGPWTLTNGVTHLKRAFDLRRNYLYNLSIIPAAQPVRPNVSIGAIDVSPASGDQDQEFIQIVNANNFAVDISDWAIEGAVEHTFAKGVVIPANSSVYVTPDVKAFRARTTGPSGGQGLFVQGDYSGHLSADGETIRVLRADGSLAAQLTYAAVTAPPVLGPIADQTLTSGIASSPIVLDIADDDTPIADLTFTAVAQSRLYLLDQQLNLTQPTTGSYPQAYYQNIRGSNEKYLLNPNGVNPVNQWYFLLPSGDFYLFTGNASDISPSALQGTFIENLGTAVYQNPALLHNATAQNVPVAFDFTTGDAPTLRITPAAGFVGQFAVTVTASDGINSDTTSFDVRVRAPVTAAPVLGPIADQSLTSGVASPPIALAVSDADTPTAALTFSGSAQSRLYLLDQELNLNAPASATYYLNVRGSNEKYLTNPNGVNPVNLWYFILPNGDFYLFTGNPSDLAPSALRGTFIANVGTAVYQNPALLHNAQPQNVPVTFSFATGSSPTMRIAPAAGFAGQFVATVTASDGAKSDSELFTVTVSEPATAPPVLGPIADRTFTAGETSTAIPLAVSDADTPTASLTFTATAQSRLYVLDQQLNLTQPTSGSYPLAYYQNIRGHNEKYLRNPNGVNPVNLWYYLLSNGDFFLFTGDPSNLSSSALRGTFIANVGAAVWQNPALLHNAQPGVPVTFSFTTGGSPSMRVTPGANFTGQFVATVTVSDGVRTDSESFLGTVVSGGQSLSGLSTPSGLVLGDTNGDRSVDLIDLAIVQSHFDLTSGATREQGDLDGDGAVTRADAAIVARNFGKNAWESPATSASAVVASANREVRRTTRADLIAVRRGAMADLVLSSSTRAGFDETRVTTAKVRALRATAR